MSAGGILHNLYDETGNISIPSFFGKCGKCGHSRHRKGKCKVQNIFGSCKC